MQLSAGTSNVSSKCQFPDFADTNISRKKTTCKCVNSLANNHIAYKQTFNTLIPP